MNCKEAQQRISNTSTAQDRKADSALQAHIAECDQCRDFAKELELTQVLASIPVPPSSEGFADRALAQAWDSAHKTDSAAVSYRPKVAMAASVLLASFLVYQTYGPEETTIMEPTVVQVTPNVTHPVHVRLVSQKALPNATISIHWDDKVALNGYPGTTTLTWQTSIMAGANEMALPVIMKSGLRGEIEIKVTSGNAQKSMRFTVEPNHQTVAALVPSQFEYNI